MPTMTTSALGTALQDLRRKLLVRETDCTDGELLEGFVAGRDGLAFATLLRRHGPMVLGVCRRILGNEADAEDAFQATFLVLVKKAASIRPRGLVGNWLYGVAHSTSLKARAMRSKRLARERAAVARPRVADPTSSDERLSEWLDQELKVLPDRYRAVIVLCDLEGASIKEAARQLGCPPGTVGTRLARGRRLLARRLARHGVVPAATVAAALAPAAEAASLPPPLLNSTLDAALGVAAIAPRVAALAEGVVRTMLLNKLKIGLAVFALLLLAVGVYATTLPPAAVRLPAPTNALLSQGGGQPVAPAKPVVVREDAAIFLIAFHPDGKSLATVGTTYELIDFKGADGVEKYEVQNSAVQLRDVRTGLVQRSLGEEKQTFFTAMAFSPDRKTAALVAIRLAKGGPLEPRVTEVRLVNAQTWAPQRKLESEGSLHVVAFSADGTVLAVGGGDHPRTENGAFVRLWDVQKQKWLGGTPEAKPPGETVRDVATCLAFSSDGKLLAVGYFSGKIHLLDGRTGERKHVLEAHGEMVNQVAFSPDGATLVSGSYDKTAKLWDVPTAKIRQALDGVKDYVMAVTFSPDGKLLATAEQAPDNKRVTLWDAQTGAARYTYRDEALALVALAFSPDGKTLAVGAAGRQKEGIAGAQATGGVILLPVAALLAKPK
jgi:RNA polymerase sigma factor (sigma-70 family)